VQLFSKKIKDYLQNKMINIWKYLRSNGNYPRKLFGNTIDYFFSYIPAPPMCCQNTTNHHQGKGTLSICKNYRLQLIAQYSLQKEKRSIIHVNDPNIHAKEHYYILQEYSGGQLN